MPLRDVPVGLVAVTIPRRAGDELRVPRDRKQRLKPTRVDLVAAYEAPPRPTDVAVADLHWLLGAERRAWPTVIGRFGAGSWATACSLALAGLVEIRCQVAGAALGDPIAMLLTARGLAERHSRRSARAEIAEALRARALTAAGAIEHLDPGLAAALRRARGADPRLPVLVLAAEDLAAGRVHDGPRAFSQTHFRHTKQRDDSPSILVEAGAGPETLAALGLERSPYLGLGGQILLDSLDLARLRGPVMFRAQDPALHAAKVAPSARALVVVENLQAAESVCDTREDVAVVYSAGQPSDAALGVIATLAAGARQVLVVPDADLGGVRIAERILGALPPTTDVQLIDVGERPHQQRDRFAAATVVALEACVGRPAGKLASSVLARGYPVEQEAATRGALSQALAAPGTDRQRRSPDVTAAEEPPHGERV